MDLVTIAVSAGDGSVVSAGGVEIFVKDGSVLLRQAVEESQSVYVRVSVGCLLRPLSSLLVECGISVFFLQPHLSAPRACV